MTVSLSVKVSGDKWYNREEFVRQLQTLSNQDIEIDVNSEGPSLTALGVVDLVKTYCPHNQVTVTRWNNSKEVVPFDKVECNSYSHFWNYSKNYWTQSKFVTSAEYDFGLFIGRHTIARNCIQYDALTCYPGRFLLSQMINRNPDRWCSNESQAYNLENFDNWVPPDQQKQVIEYLENNTIPSLDNKEVQDQYTIVEQSSAECMLSILEHYKRFLVEIVCETYTIGDTFFPTEKTVRPIMAAKPFLLYGPRHFLKHIRELGYQTYDQCWNESYDQYEGAQRWQAMKKIIDQWLLLDPDKKLEVLNLAGEIARYNRQKLIDKGIENGC